MVVYTVSSIMQSPVVDIAGNATVAEALHRMREAGISSILVRPDGPEDVYGIMTKHDVIAKVVSQEKDPKTLLVRDLMSKPVITIPPDLSLRDCSDLMTEKRIRRVAVTQGKQILGIVSDTDIFRAVEEGGWGPKF